MEAMNALSGGWDTYKQFALSRMGRGFLNVARATLSQISHISDSCLVNGGNTLGCQEVSHWGISRL